MQSEAKGRRMATGQPRPRRTCVDDNTNLQFVRFILDHERLVLSRAWRPQQYNRWQQALHEAVTWADSNSPEIVDVLCRISCDLREVEE